MIRKITPFYVSCLFMLVAFFAAPVSAQNIVEEIRIEGTQRIEPETVLSYMKLKTGVALEQAALDKSLKNLFATGLFADVALKQDGETLIVRVVENPIINEIAFEGNRRIKDDELMSEIQLRPRQVFTRTKVQFDLTRLYQIYRRQGRFSASIEPKVIRLDQNRVNLVFELDEGALTKVRSVRFVGNKRFDDDRLREELSTKETSWYSFVSANDRYDPDRLSYDQELLRRFYLSQGYADFRILSAVAELSDDREYFFITVTLEEGERYKVNNVQVASALKDFDASLLDDYIKFNSGAWYNADEIKGTIDELSNVLADHQYAFVNVRPKIERNREESTLDVTFQIDESPRVFVERIDIHGNVRTLDKVLRREVEVAEGDPFNKTKLAASEQNIKDLGYFENVKMTTKRGSAPDKTVVDIEVAEKSTGELSVGAGFSTSDGALADIRIRERNFLGKGQDLLFATVFASERTEFDLSFTEPYFLDRDLSAGVDLFHITRDLQEESSYDQKRSGGALRFGYPLSDNWRQTLKYRFESNEILNVGSTASLFIRRQEGERDTSAISQRLTYDTRDSSVFPTTGLLYWLDTELAGLAGDAKYISGKTGASYFYPIAPRWIFNLEGELAAISGYGDTDVAINERYFLGGSNLRGFESAGVGPRDSTTKDALGGNYFYRASAEMSFPLGLPEEFGFLGHLFTDAGSLWDNDDTGSGVLDDQTIRASAGIGFSWRSPFGPIRMDFAKPFAKEDYDEEETFRFNFGTRF